MVLHQQYVSICAAARRKGEGEGSMRKTVTMRGHNTAHAPSRSPRHRPWISWRRGLSRLGQENQVRGLWFFPSIPLWKAKPPSLQAGAPSCLLHSENASGHRSSFPWQPLQSMSACVQDAAAAVGGGTPSHAPQNLDPRRHKRGRRI